MQQVVFIHGGGTFKTYQEYISFLSNIDVSLDYLRKERWRNSISKELGNSYDVIQIKMPNKSNAKYSEWKLWFEKYIPLFDQEIILIGHSLGGIFLAKYLSENTISKHIKGLFLVAAPYDYEVPGESLTDFRLSVDVKRIVGKVDNIFIYHSQDDNVVPFTDSGKYKKDLPDATLREFKDREHFNQESFPEIVKDIRSIL